MSDFVSSKRQRVSKACEQCRRKKIKCNGDMPLCANCYTLGLQCTYKESTKKRGPPKGYIEAIEGRLHRLEALLGSVIQEDDPRSQAILKELNAPLETAYGEVVRPRPMRKPDMLGPGEEESDMQDLTLDPSSAESVNDVSDKITDDNDENTNDNLGNLSIDESGQLRYYGKSSGFYMLRSSKNFQNGAFHFNSKGYRSRSSEQDSVLNMLSVDPYELPPQDLSAHLLDLYFDHFYPLLPLLHKKSFLESLKSKDHPPPLLLLNAIYAVASRISPDVRVRAKPDLPDSAGDIFFERARILLDFEWDDFRLSTVQSLLLMSSHQNGALKNIRGWLYSGLAFRMSQNLGLNRNCDSWHLSETEKEERKRVFYCCFVVDRLTCAMHGRAPMIDERDYDTPYPMQNDEDDLDRSPRIMDNFHQLIKLCEILGEVLCNLYTVKSRKRLSIMATPDSVISKLDKMLNNWMAKLPQSVQYRPPNTRMAEHAPAPTLELCQLHMLFYTTVILLHRPFIPGPTQTTALSAFPSAAICTFAANKILDIVQLLMEENRLKNVNNYALYFMFTAGIIFINDAASTDSMFAFEAKISINKIIRAMDTVEATWITSARHCNILGELAGLRDINLECVDENYTKRPQQREWTPSLSITVPNSPEMDNGSPESKPRVTRSLMASQTKSSMLPYYLSGYATSSGPATDFESKDLLRQSSHSYQPSPLPTSRTEHSSPQPIALPTHVADNYASPDQAQSLDVVGTAFWNVPMSFDIDEWNIYFNKQNYRPQTLLSQASPPYQSNPSSSAEDAAQSQAFYLPSDTRQGTQDPSRIW
ncbi:fungal-specific transcription factor domain-containing protein [Radiomyces spectabilis]|uniref:fungal-specific transcription factor domain-containing protein n=1 Tax=Radiomyces spectabilis TaxID=64574 RepID=UPI00221FF4D4|nr:fungal-specific transcription factor domain-containing protein [Radiomyces spectabilis]KAI8379141.1 fungal-specific transcription factor domain-containing protein [Radiomyces spectabilis]